MKRLLLFCLKTSLALVVLLGTLLGYYVYTPASQAPHLSGDLTRGSVQAGGMKRSYLTYLPRALPRGAPLVVVMHGSGGNGAHMRKETGYGFDRLADQHAFAVVYPDAEEGYWDVCSVVGRADANGLDDVGFLVRLVDTLVAELGIDPQRVFATGGSRGGAMALRLALEAPSRFRAVAAVSASVPTADNFKCKPADQGASSVMLMNGTDDPLVPFEGGEVSLFGLFYKNGKVMSSRESGQYFANLNHIAGAPETSVTQLADAVRVEDVRWHDESSVQVELVAIHGAGHGIPQPWRRRPRLLGPSPMQPNGPELIWAFFERQQP